MGAITGVKTVLTEFAGQYKILHLTATLASSSDVITLTEATHGITVIKGIINANIKTGMGANFQSLQVSFNGLVITIVLKQNGGSTGATSWGDIGLSLIGY